MIPFSLNTVHMIKLVVFDMAGTTINEDNVVYKTLLTAINNRGFNISLDQVLAEGAGREKLQAIKSILKEYAHNTDYKLANEIYQDFVVLLSVAYKDLQVTPQSNAVELFLVLKQRNIKIVLNTGYDAETAESLVSKLGWKKGVEFDCLITASDVENNRPDPEMIKLAMEIYNIQNPKEVVKIGDSIIDIEEGQNAGCGLSIGITTGAHNYQQLQSASPDYIINDLMQLVPILERIGK
jgi:phosphonatase-like hydrolase